MLDFAKRIHLVGCGGIGSKLIMDLLQLLNADKFKGEILLWDGDRFEKKNAERQDFPLDGVGYNKAEVKKLDNDYDGLQIIARTEYVDKTNIDHVVHDNAIVFTGVDNHPVRVLIDKAASKINNICVISAGNDMYDGNVHIYLRREGDEITQSFVARHPDAAKVRKGKRTNAEGCLDKIEAGETQLITANRMAATCALMAFQALWYHGRKYDKTVEQKIIPQELYFDIATCAVATVEAAS